MPSEALYVHIPFCRSICYYCDFCRVIYNRQRAERYLKELARELERYAGSHFKTVYIGGGTPTALDHDLLEQLLILLNPLIDEVTEYTIEINPETIDEEKISLLSKHHINRVSVGIQTFNDQLLKSVGRKHSLEDIRNCIGLLRKYGITNISCDLLYGLPEQSVYDFMDSLKTAVKMQLPHISFYMLTIEENSVFGKKGVKTQDEDISDEMYFEGIRYLEENGYHQYEISNFALEGYESKHNRVYWEYGDYAAVGMGASGKENNIRYSNTTSFDEYFKGNYRSEELRLSEEDVYFETVMMGLRLKDGIKITDELCSYYQEVIERLISEEKLTYSDGTLKCTDRGYYILNDVLLEFIPD